MIPILFETITEGTAPTNYGIGALTDALACEVKEERNGSYELTMTYASEGIHASEIQPNRFILAKPNFTDDPQIFRIYKVGKKINGRFSIDAQHISYDLSGKTISTGTAGSCAAACLLLDAQAGNFNIETDINKSASFAITTPSSVRSWFGGKEGSLLDVYGGEWKYNNYTASLKSARGTDRGVTIRYGKNLTDLSQVLDMSNLVTGVIPYYLDAEGNKIVGTRVSTGLVLDVPRDLAIDFSNEVNPESATPIAAQLPVIAAGYIANNNLTTPSNSITLDFVQMKELTERVDLCDTVHIYYEPLGITASAKCIATVWDVLEERYKKTTFGEARTNIADTIASNTKAVENAASKAYVNESSQLITGNLGGYVILDDSDGDGKPDQILIMNTDNKATATQVWRFNKGGLGYGSSYSGPFNDIALTADGKINASRIVTGTLTANVIKAGVLSDAQGNSSIDMTNGSAKMLNFDAKKRFRLLSAADVEKLSITHNNGSGTSLIMKTENGQTGIELSTASAYGGVLGISNYLNNDVAGFSPQSNYHGLMYINSKTGARQVDVNASDNGGNIGLYSADSTKTRVSLFGNDTYGGALEVFDGNNRGTGWLEGASSGGDGAKLSLADAGGTIRAIMWGSGSFKLFNGSGTNTIVAYGPTGNITCVSLTQTSSRKVKDNIEPIPDARKILELEAVRFDYKNEDLGTDKRGFIAEDVEKILPNLVTPEADGRNASLDYIGMIPYLQAVIKEQDERIKALEEKINKLEG